MWVREAASLVLRACSCATPVVCVESRDETSLGCLPTVLSILFYVRSISLADFLKFVCDVRTRQKLSTCKVLFFAPGFGVPLVNMNEHVVQSSDG